MAMALSSASFASAVRPNKAADQAACGRAAEERRSSISKIRRSNVAAAGQARADCADRNPRNSGCILIGHALQAHEQDHLPLLRVKLGYARSSSNILRLRDQSWQASL
jgi:hypothetical protein